MIEGLEYDERPIRARMHRTPLRGLGASISVIGGLGWDVPEDEYTDCGLTCTLRNARRRTNLYFDPTCPYRQLEQPPYQTYAGLSGNWGLGKKFLPFPITPSEMKQTATQSIWDLLLASIRRKLGI